MWDIKRNIILLIDSLKLMKLAIYVENQFKSPKKISFPVLLNSHPHPPTLPKKKIYFFF